MKNYASKAISLIIPVIVVIGLDVEMRYNNAGSSHALLRGVIYMAIGIELAYMIKSKIVTINRYLSVLNVLTIVSAIGMFLAMNANGNFDYLTFFFSPIIITAAVTQDSWLAKLFSASMWSKLGEIAMEMYFIHIFWANVIFILLGTNIFDNMPVPAIYSLYIVIVTTSAYFLHIFSNKIRKRVFYR